MQLISDAAHSARLQLLAALVVTAQTSTQAVIKAPHRSCWLKQVGWWFTQNNIEGYMTNSYLIDLEDELPGKEEGSSTPVWLCKYRIGDNPNALPVLMEINHANYDQVLEKACDCTQYRKWLAHTSRQISENWDNSVDHQSKSLEGSGDYLDTDDDDLFSPHRHHTGDDFVASLADLPLTRQSNQD